VNSLPIELLPAVLQDSFYETLRLQRPYSWTLDNVGDLWSDTVQQSSDQYFIGAFIVCRRGDENDNRPVDCESDAQYPGTLPGQGGSGPGQEGEPRGVRPPSRTRRARPSSTSARAPSPSPARRPRPPWR
jgi:hypothetical protein